MIRVFRARVWMAVVTAALLCAVPIYANTGCGIGPTACSGACPAGCGFSVPITHFVNNPCTPLGPVNSGAFDLTGTQYEATCSTPACGNQIAPPQRFWFFDNYQGGGGTEGNSGCYDYTSASIPPPPPPMGNVVVDYGNLLVGHWVNDQTDWQNLNADGCPSGVTAATGRTIVEISDVCSVGPPACNGFGQETTINHSSWYLIVSVPFDTTFSNYSISGANGGQTVNGALMCDTILPVQEVLAPTISGRVAACTGTTTPDLATPDAVAGFADIDIVVPALPGMFSESGHSVGGAAISGYQIMYTQGVEPTSSVAPPDPASAWIPVGTPGTPATFLPAVTAAGTVSVAFADTGMDTWFAIRIVYQDATVNDPAGAFYDAATGGPQLTSQMSGHCGPVQTVIGAVVWGEVKAVKKQDGNSITWTTLDEDDTQGFTVMRATDLSGMENVEAVADWVAEHGAYVEYEVMDYAVATDSTTYYYYVQEITSTGLGMRSPVVKVESASSKTRSATGARSRSTRR